MGRPYTAWGVCVCVCACVCVCVRVCVYACAYIYMCVCVCACVYACMRVRIYMCVCVCVCARVCLCVLLKKCQLCDQDNNNSRLGRMIRTAYRIMHTLWGMIRLGEEGGGELRP